jgi:hypothetical protein
LKAEKIILVISVSLTDTHQFYPSLVGKPIAIPSTKEGQSQDDVVRELHGKYMQALQAS